MQIKNQDLVSKYTSLSLAIERLLEKQEKDYGCFQTAKEGEFSALYVPSLPSFKLYQNPKSLIYRGYWRTDKELPKPTDTKAFPPDLWIRKKQKKVAISQNLTRNETDIKAKQQIYEFKSPQIDGANRVKTITKKQRVYEIVYRYHPAIEVRVVNQLVANFLKQKIEASITSVPEEEIFPLVLIGDFE